MIRINLLGEQVDDSQSFLMHVAAGCGSLLATMVLCVILQTNAMSRVEEVRGEKEQLESRLMELKKVTKRVESLEANKKLLREKLQTISVLKLKKRGPVQIVDSMRAALPERAWLLSSKEKAGSLEISGLALDNQTISEFMGNLKKSEFFGKVDLVVSSQKLKDKVKLKQFLVVAQIADPLERARKRQAAEAAANSTATPTTPPTTPAAAAAPEGPATENASVKS